MNSSSESTGKGVSRNPSPSEKHKQAIIIITLKTRTNELHMICSVLVICAAYIIKSTLMAALKLPGFLCATSVSSVSLWLVFTRNFINHRDTEDTEVAQRRGRAFGELQLHCSIDTTVTDLGSSFKVIVPPSTFPEIGLGTTVFGDSKVFTLSTFGAVSV